MANTPQATLRKLGRHVLSPNENIQAIVLSGDSCNFSDYFERSDQ